MNDADVLIDFLTDLRRDVADQLEGMTAEQIAWQPDAEGNSIGVTVWHFCRWLDLVAVRAFGDRPQSEEQWWTQGWATSTGYDPAGIGQDGFGAITGYTVEEARAIPHLSAADLTMYLDQVCSAMIEAIRVLPEGALHELAPGGQDVRPGRTRYGWIKPILQGSMGHLGEIEALKGLQQRAGKLGPTPGDQTSGEG